MKEYVHLKDGVVFAHHKSENDVDDSSDNVIKVEGDLDYYLNKKYENGQFVDAQLLKYAILDNNTVVGIQQTYFSSDAGSNPIINDDNVTFLWTWDGTKFNPPAAAIQHDVISVGNVPVTSTSQMPALDLDAYQKQKEEAEFAINNPDIIAKQEEINKLLAEQASEQSVAPTKSA